MEDGGEDRTKFVIGLGNPGRKYRRTRHNVGFMVAEMLAERWAMGDGREKFSARVRDGRVARGGRQRRVVLAEPMTYMNRSGRSVRELADFYNAEPADLLVVLDDMALETGRIRVRPGGSAGGHNGMSDILAQMGTDRIPRLRVGIGAAPGPMDPADYVLGKFDKKEMELIGPAVPQAADAVEDWLFDGIDKAMQKYNANSDTTGNEK